MNKAATKVIQIICATLWLISSAFAIEIKTENGVSKDGENIITTYFEGEPDGVIKRIIYGNGPKYRLVQLIFESNSLNKVDHADYFDVVILGAEFSFSTAERINFYFRNDSDGIERREIKKEDGMVIEESYYRKGSKGGLVLIRYHNYSNGKTQFIEQYYENIKENTSRINTYIETYENGEVKNEVYKYFPNTKFMTERITQYLPPEFTQKEDKPWKIYTIFKDDPEGLVRTEGEYSSGNKLSVIFFYDYTKNPNGLSKMVTLYLNDEIVRQIHFFGIPKPGKLYMRIIDRTADGKIINQYADGDNKEMPAPNSK